METTDSSTQKNKTNWKSQAGQLLSGGLFGFLLVSYYFRHDVTFSATSALLILVIAIISFIAGVIIHELGHAVAGKLSGMTIMNLSFGPFIYAKTDGQSRFYFKLPAMGYVGRAMLRFAQPISESQMRKSMIRLFYGGPLSNLVIGVPLLATSFYYGWSGWFVFALINIFFGLTNLANIEGAGVQSDGRVIAMLNGKLPGDDLILVSYQILQEDPQGEGNWSEETAEKVKSVIERYPGWPLAATLLSTVGPYYYHSNPHAYLDLAEGRSFLPRDKRAGILQDITDISVATGYYYADRLKTEPTMKEKLHQIGTQETVARHMRDMYLAIIDGNRNQALTSNYAAEAALGDWHPLYLEGSSLKRVLREIRQDVKSS